MSVPIPGGTLEFLRKEYGETYADPAQIAIAQPTSAPSIAAVPATGQAAGPHGNFSAFKAGILIADPTAKPVQVPPPVSGAAQANAKEFFWAVLNIFY